MNSSLSLREEVMFLKAQGLNSYRVAQKLGISLKECNKVYGTPDPVHIPPELKKNG